MIAEAEVARVKTPVGVGFSLASEFLSFPGVVRDDPSRDKAARKPLSRGITVLRHAISLRLVTLLCIRFQRR